MHPSSRRFAVVKQGTSVHSSIVREFGEEILAPDGEIDRKKLADVIFANKRKRKILNRLTHPAIYRRMAWDVFQYFLKGKSNLVILDLESTNCSKLLLLPFFFLFRNSVHHFGVAFVVRERREPSFPPQSDRCLLVSESKFWYLYLQTTDMNLGQPYCLALRASTLP